MSYTIFTSNPSALIPQPGRAVNTFPSGLVRVDQTYLGLTSQAATHRATLAVGNNMPDGDSSPCIDGLKIFPEPQEVRRADGFTEFVVSAYGRINLTGSVSSTFEEGVATLTQTSIGQGSVTTGSTNVSCFNEVLVFSKVVTSESFPTTKIPDGATLRSWVGDSTSPGDTVLIQAVYPPGTFYEYNQGAITTTRTVSTSAKIIQNSSKHFGYWSERILTLQAVTVISESIVYGGDLQ